MGHELEVNALTNTLSMLYVGATPWHVGGMKLATPPTSLGYGFRELMGAAYNVDKVQATYTYNGETHQIDDRFVLVRSDTGAAIGACSDRYQVLQPAATCDVYQPLVDSGEVSIETAGVLRGGSRMWMLAKINRDPVEIVPGDPIVKYLLLSNSWTGKDSLFYGLTDVRVVCNNTHTAALASKASKLLRIKHRGDLAVSLAKAKEAIDMIDADFKKTAELYKTLARKAVGAKELQAFFSAITKLTKDEQDAALASAKDATQQAKDDAVRHEHDAVDLLEAAGINASVATANARVIDSIVDATFAQAQAQTRTVLALQTLAEAGIGTDIPGVRGTLYGAFNAVTEYVNHHGPDRGQDAKLESLGFGHGSRMIERALDIATKML